MFYFNPKRFYPSSAEVKNCQSILPLPHGVLN
jgi:hypothetical protein